MQLLESGTYIEEILLHIFNLGLFWATPSPGETKIHLQTVPRQPNPSVFHCQYSIQWGFLGGSGLKKLPANAENVGSTPGQEDPLE